MKQSEKTAHHSPLFMVLSAVNPLPLTLSQASDGSSLSLSLSWLNKQWSSPSYVHANVLLPVTTKQLINISTVRN